MLWGKFFKALIAMGWGSPSDFWAFPGPSRWPLTQAPAAQLTFSTLFPTETLVQRFDYFAEHHEEPITSNLLVTSVKFSACGWCHRRNTLHSS